MGNVKHIRANTKPATLENDAIYFVKNGEIWMKFPDGTEVQFGCPDNILKFEWSGSISSVANKKQYAVYNYGAPRNYVQFRRYHPDNDIMNDAYRVPFINVLPFDIELQFIVFDVGMRQYPRAYQMMVSVMAAKYDDVQATKQHILLNEFTTKSGGGSADINKDVIIYTTTDLLTTKLKAGEFITVGLGIDNTNDGSNRSTYFSAFTIFAKKI